MPPTPELLTTILASLEDGKAVDIVTSDSIPNLDGTGFNDRASSLRVERGYWLFCSDMQFQGECRTFAPGDYPTLPRGLNDAVLVRLGNDIQAGERRSAGAVRRAADDNCQR